FACARPHGCFPCSREYLASLESIKTSNEKHPTHWRRRRYPWRVMSDSKFDRKKLEAQLQQLSAQIAELVTKLETAVGREAEALRPKLKVAQEQLRDLKERSGEAWGDLKPGMKRAW